MSYKPYRIDEIEWLEIGKKVRVIGYIIRDKALFLKDPLSDYKIPLSGRNISVRKDLVEVFGIWFGGKIVVDFILEAKIDENLLKAYKDFIRREREDLLIGMIRDLWTS